jgi:hypothetical protein
MAIVAASYRIVRPLAPSIELVIHDVAIDASFRVVAEVGKLSRIMERKNAQARKCTHKADQITHRLDSLEPSTISPESPP